MTNCRTENVLYFVYENNTPEDIKELLKNKYPSAKTFNIDEIERLKKCIVRSKEVQAVAVIFDGLGGNRKDAFYKNYLLPFKEAMGVYFKTNVVLVEVFTNCEASKSHCSDEEFSHNQFLTNNSPMLQSQVDEGSISNWFSELVAETFEGRFMQIDVKSTIDFDTSVSKITSRIKSFHERLNCISSICLMLCGLLTSVFIVTLLYSSYMFITCYYAYNKPTCNSSVWFQSA